MQITLESFIQRKIKRTINYLWLFRPNFSQEGKRSNFQLFGFQFSPMEVQMFERVGRNEKLEKPVLNVILIYNEKEK